jgi:hypothetical protein
MRYPKTSAGSFSEEATVPITFHCPKCRHKLRSRDGSEGRRVRCPGCKTAAVVPGMSLGPAEFPAGMDVPVPATPRRSGRVPSWVQPVIAGLAVSIPIVSCLVLLCRPEVTPKPPDVVPVVAKVQMPEVVLAPEPETTIPATWPATPADRPEPPVVADVPPAEVGPAEIPPAPPAEPTAGLEAVLAHRGEREAASSKPAEATVPDPADDPPPVRRAATASIPRPARSMPSAGYSSLGSSGSSMCGALTKKGLPCRRMVRGGGYCYQHR